MNEAIKLAIEKGGYNVIQFIPAFHQLPQRKVEVFLKANYSRIQLDPLFWQALGKALGWKERIDYVYGGGDDKIKAAGIIDEWLYHCHRFIDHIAEGKSPDDFFKQLIKTHVE